MNEPPFHFIKLKVASFYKLSAVLLKPFGDVELNLHILGEFGKWDPVACDVRITCKADLCGESAGVVREI